MTAIGNVLERRVATYYEALGYRVTRNVNIDGHQIDLVAEKLLPGASPITIAVEAKSRASSCGVNDVTSFIVTAKQLILNESITSAVIVTDANITQDARSAVAKSRAIRLMHISDLELDLFNSAESLFRVKNDYESSRIFSEYYSIGLIARSANKDDAVQYITDWCNQRHGTLVVLGDFGSGKSTILERSFYEAVMDRLDRRDAPYPIMLKLRALRHHADLWQFIEATLRDNQYFMPAKSSFYRELDAGRLRIFLDGFDEIYTGATIDDRASYLTMLSPLLISPSPCVLSSRPTFFDSIAQVMSAVGRLNRPLTPLAGLPDYLREDRIAEAVLETKSGGLHGGSLSEIVQLKGLGDRQISAVIEQHREAILENTGLNPETFKAGLYRIYDLRDLMTRPILLKMIVKTTAAGKLDMVSTKSIEPSALYLLYTQLSAIRDEEKERSIHFLKVTQRLAACREIAWAMLNKGEIVLTASEIRKIVPAAITAHSKKATRRAAPGQLDNEVINRALTDVKVCSFLQFSDDGSLTFTHKSYFEFFVAQRMFLLSKDNQPEFIESAKLKFSRETVYFLASYARDNPPLRAYIKMRLRMEASDEQRDFVYRLAFATGSILDGCTFLQGEISNVDMIRARVSSLYFDDVTLQDATMRDVTGWAWTFRNVLFRQVAMESVKIERSKLDLTAEDLEVSASTFLDTDLDMAGARIRFQDVRMAGGQLSLSCPLLAIATHVKSTKVSFEEGSSFSNNSSVRLEEAELRASEMSGWYAGNAQVELQDCMIAGLAFGIGDLVKVDYEKRRLPIRLKGCRGLAVVNLSGDTRGELLRKIAGHDNPDLTFVDKNAVEQALKLAAKQDEANRKRMESKKDEAEKPASDAASPIKAPSKPVEEDHKVFELTPEISEARTQVLDAIKRWNIEPTTLPRELRELLRLQS